MAPRHVGRALAKLDLAERLWLADIDPIRLAKIGKVDWGNTSLGNPQPGMMYDQVIVPGFEMLLEADGAFYMYHTSQEKAVLLMETLDITVTDEGSGEVVTEPTPKDDVDHVGTEVVRVT